MIRFLLDTNAVIALKNNRSRLLLDRLRAHRPGETAVSAIVLHELYYGAFRSQQLARILEVVRLLRQDLAILDFDAPDAREAGDIGADLAKAGRSISPYDVLIAGQAVARSLVLVTSNTGEFNRIPRLKLEDWTQPSPAGFHED